MEWVGHRMNIYIDLYMCIFNLFLNSWPCIFAQNGFTIFCSRNNWKHLTLTTLFQSGTDCGWAESLSLSLVHTYSWDAPLLSSNERPGCLPGSLSSAGPGFQSCVSNSVKLPKTQLYIPVTCCVASERLPCTAWNSAKASGRRGASAGLGAETFFSSGILASHILPSFFGPNSSSYHLSITRVIVSLLPAGLWTVCHPLSSRIRKPEERSGLQHAASFSLLFSSLASSSADSVTALVHRNDSFEIQID